MGKHRKKPKRQSSLSRVPRGRKVEPRESAQEYSVGDRVTIVAKDRRDYGKTFTVYKVWKSHLGTTYGLRGLGHSVHGDEIVPARGLFQSIVDRFRGGKKRGSGISQALKKAYARDERARRAWAEARRTGVGLAAAEAELDRSISDLSRERGT